MEHKNAAAAILINTNVIAGDVDNHCAIAV